MDAYLEPEGCEFFCEDCAPDTAEAHADGGGEADTPQHCANCGVPLENPLTSDGVHYVLNEAEEEARRPASERNRIMPLKGTGEETMTWWHGSPHKAIVQGWLKQVSNYRLGEREQRKLEAINRVLERD